MVKIYTRSASLKTVKNLVAYLKEHDTAYEMVLLAPGSMTPKEVKSLLAGSIDGFDGILSKRSTTYKAHECNIEDMTMTQMVDLIIQKPGILKEVIAVKHGQVVSNSWDDREFLVRKDRKHSYNTGRLDDPLYNKLWV